MENTNTRSRRSSERRGRPEAAGLKTLYVVTHVRPHVDELYGAALIAFFGGRKGFYGMDRNTDVRVVYSPEGLPAGSYFGLGTGGGPYDEHAREGASEKSLCAAELVARRLDVHEHPAVKGALQHVAAIDRGACKEEPLGIGRIAQAAMRGARSEVDELQAIELIVGLLTELLAERIRFHENRNGGLLVDERGAGPWRVVRVQAAQGQEARFRAGAPRALMIERPEGARLGNVQVECACGTLAASIARDLRVAEALKRGRAVELSLFGSPGSLEGNPEWFFFLRGSAASVMNGCEPHPHVPKSALTNDEVWRIVTRNIQK